MSKNRKKKSSKKRKPNNRKPVQKRKQATAFETIKTFFNELISKLKEKIELNNFIDKVKIISYTKINRQGIIFTFAMIAIVAVGYFAIVYESPEDKQARIDENTTVSIDLSEETTDYMDDVESELDYVSMEDETDVPEVKERASDEGVDVEETPAEEEGDLAVLEVDEPEVDLSADVISTPAEVANDFDMMSVEDSIMLGVEVYAIIVDGDAIAYFETEGEAFVVLKDLKNKYKQDGATEEEIIFREEIAIEKVKLDILEFGGYRSKEEIIEYIVKGTNEQRIHVVKPGENFWVIAEQYELNVQSLIDANPDIDERRLQINTELSLIVPEPLINVVTISTVERIDPIPYGRDSNVKTEQYYVGTYRPKVNGVNGEAKNVVQIYMENGKIIGEKITSTQVLKEPTNLVMYEGTKPAPPMIGTGTFQNPTSRGYITSRFGPRSLGYHYGIDIGLPMRSDVYAADGGIVIYAGYKGSYGKLVIIDHGGNKHSYYAHNDELLVSSGDNIPKGFLIALSGNTGRSTGPHLHFEVRINGTSVNPSKYVSY
jgi:murein DD-endopeptidase MepM/ murein hydrolase activator NlpD